MSAVEEAIDLCKEHPNLTWDDMLAITDEKRRKALEKLRRQRFERDFPDWAQTGEED